MVYLISYSAEELCLAQIRLADFHLTQVLFSILNGGVQLAEFLSVVALHLLQKSLIDGPSQILAHKLIKRGHVWKLSTKRCQRVLSLRWNCDSLSVVIASSKRAASSLSFLCSFLDSRNFIWASSRFGFFSKPSSSMFSIGILTGGNWGLKTRQTCTTKPNFMTF